ncbi:hypothetical protein ACFLUA_02970 [Chloroflexota bacterium]
MKNFLKIILLLLLSSGLLLSCQRPPGRELNELNRAALVVQSGDGSTKTFCISFENDTVSGYELLQRSSLPIIAGRDSTGIAICRIGEYGCSEEDCFCASPPDYWSYWHMEDEDWVYSPLGSVVNDITNGDVDGWAWGPAIPPPLIPFNEICHQQ